MRCCRACRIGSTHASQPPHTHRGIHYFDLTEDVATTKTIIDLSKTSQGLMAPQCGLAPGFVGIVGAAQVGAFEKCRSLRLRVGALPQNPTGLMGYAFNWSPEGVVNEYLNDCEVIEDGVRKTVSSMEWIETVYVEGVMLEAFTTSGGLGTICETFHGKVANVDYKSMRYPGHMRLMNFFFHELLMRERRDLAGEILTNAKPPVNDDVVYVHVSSEGTLEGRLQRREFVRAYRPIDTRRREQTAIAWTTSASVVSVIQMVRDGQLPQRGFLKQEDIPLDKFLATTDRPTVRGLISLTRGSRFATVRGAIEHANASSRARCRPIREAFDRTARNDPNPFASRARRRHVRHLHGHSVAQKRHRRLRHSRKSRQPSAARGAKTPIPASPATCPRTSIRFRSS